MPTTLPLYWWPHFTANLRGKSRSARPFLSIQSHPLSSDCSFSDLSSSRWASFPRGLIPGSPFSFYILFLANLTASLPSKTHGWLSGPLSQAILDTTTWYFKFSMAQTQLNILSLKPVPPPVFHSVYAILLLWVWWLIPPPITWYTDLVPHTPHICLLFFCCVASIIQIFIVPWRHHCVGCCHSVSGNTWKPLAQSPQSEPTWPSSLSLTSSPTSQFLCCAFVSVLFSSARSLSQLLPGQFLILLEDFIQNSRPVGRLCCSFQMEGGGHILHKRLLERLRHSWTATSLRTGGVSFVLLSRTKDLHAADPQMLAE